MDEDSRETSDVNLHFWFSIWVKSNTFELRINHSLKGEDESGPWYQWLVTTELMTIQDHTHSLTLRSAPGSTMDCWQ